MILTESDERRFWSKVALPNEQGCMLWTKYVRPDGYVSFYLSGKQVLIHRVSYTLAYGSIPDGLVIDHVKAKGCTNRHCVAPAHLEAVAGIENHRRGDAGGNMRAKTHCPQGHPYSSENTYVYPRGHRRCRACGREQNRDYSRRRRADSVV
ncbi:HNH endonuclease [Streptomyces sp. NPDC087420]|uniref:HNH endonuclease n=1 Tax=Streptomyces sp. NPDC087420 TaxID=3365785 RepID=UPI003836816F